MKRCTASVCIATAIVLGAACEQLDRVATPPPITGPTPTAAIEPLHLVPSSTILDVGRSTTLNAFTGQTRAAAEWSSANAAIARFDGAGLVTSGSVTCVTPGDTVITARPADRTLAPATALVTCLEANVVTMTPELPFEHIIGRSPCPQLAGVVTIRKTAGAGGTTVFLQSLHPALEIRRTAVTLSKGEEAQVEVFFNCGVREPFTGQISGAFSAGAGTSNLLTQVRGDVHP